MKKNGFIVIASLLLIYTQCLWATVFPSTKVIHQESDSTLIDIKYPQGFSNQEMNKELANFVTNELSKFEKSKVSVNDLPKDYAGKNSLYIDYKIIFQNKHIISILFTLSQYSAGAAHPNNSMKTFNFIDGKLVQLDDLFKKDSQYLKQIADFCQTALLKKEISEKKWIIDGSRPTAENYKNWYFNQHGLSIVFNPYQVAAYVYGEQTVIIPRTVLSGWMKATVSKALWGN